MDSDLAESIAALRECFSGRRHATSFGQAPPEVVASLKERLRLPRRYREFLLHSDPLAIEVVTPSERVRLLPSAALEGEQRGFALDEGGARLPRPNSRGWRPAWIIVARSGLLGDPYFLDTALVDAEGDCPVFTAMSGKEAWQPLLCASTFALFLRILAITASAAREFGGGSFDVEDEAVFREALRPRIREYDPAALKAGHWT